MNTTTEIYPVCARCGWPEPDRGQIEEFRAKADSVTSFLEEEGIWPAANDWMLVTRLRLRYQAYCRRKGVEPRAGRTFAQRLEENGITIANYLGDRVAFVMITV